MFSQQHTGKHLSDIYFRKTDGNAGIMVGLLLCHGLVFRTLTALTSSESESKLRRPLYRESVFVVQGCGCPEYLCSFLADH